MIHSGRGSALLPAEPSACLASSFSREEVAEAAPYVLSLLLLLLLLTSPLSDGEGCRLVSSMPPPPPDAAALSASAPDRDRRGVAVLICGSSPSSSFSSSEAPASSMCRAMNAFARADIADIARSRAAFLRASIDALSLPTPLFAFASPSFDALMGSNCAHLWSIQWSVLLSWPSLFDPSLAQLESLSFTRADSREQLLDVESVREAAVACPIRAPVVLSPSAGASASSISSFKWWKKRRRWRLNDWAGEEDDDDDDDGVVVVVAVDTVTVCCCCCCSS
mmetsp:Transcript_50407/g.68532  ORF Transcript_50407/g.68532 Transcript_50407/m.68532 type:complete len:279 (-) Transcript_50407:275-1111(-)